MRTTVELPDELLKRAKVEAVERGVSLKKLISTALAKELSGGAPGGRPPKRLTFPLFGSQAPGTLELTSADISRAEREEDVRRHGISR